MSIAGLTREPLDVLGREVRRGADDARLARELLLGAPALEREPEVEQLDRAVDDERVRRLDVAVDHAARVQEREPLGELREHGAHAAEIDARRARRDRDVAAGAGVTRTSVRASCSGTDAARRRS